MNKPRAAAHESTSPRVLLGVCGSIAAYKGADLCSKLVQAGHDVTVILTRAASRLVGPLTFSALSGNAVALDWVEGTSDPDIEHIHLADAADLFVVAPATANFLAKAAHGLADDMLTSTLLAAQCPVLVAPAMNVNMWKHPAVTRNLDLVKSLGYEVLEPDSGRLACGWEGAGRLPEPADILAAAQSILAANRS